MDAENGTLESMLEYLKHHRGFDFTGYKRSSLIRRVQRRMQAVEVSGFEGYLDFLEVHPEEFAFLFNTILINVTSFFRDEESWTYLAEQVLPRLIAGRKEGAPIRIWCAGCASGEEAYTMTMLLAEELGAETCRERVKIYATDVDEESLNKARQASYTPRDVRAIPVPLRDKYFTPSGNRYIFDNNLRRIVIFGRHDLIQDAPISRLDLLTCRNTLIYFNAEAQRRILARFHFALNDGGYLFLGRAEMLLTHAHLFSPAGELKHRVFTKVLTNVPRDRMVILTQAGDAAAADQLGFYVRLRETAFDVAPIAQIVLDRDDNLALANRRARETFGLDYRDLGRPFRDLELSYRPIELRSLIEQARRERRSVTRASVERSLPDGGTQYLNLQVDLLSDNGGYRLGIGIAFEDVTSQHELRDEVERSRHELETAREELQSTNEELETTNEELQSSNEELQTTNEELQSTNEEMETMNEELQATNEELQAMNDEIRRRSRELDRSNAFLQSILASVDMGVVVIDREFHVLLWNEGAKELWGLDADEVRGCSFLDLDIGLPVGQLHQLLPAFVAKECQAGEVLLQATNRRGKPIDCQVAYHCLRVGADQIEGVVLLMTASDREGQGVSA